MIGAEEMVSSGFASVTGDMGVVLSVVAIVVLYGDSLTGTRLLVERYARDGIQGLKVLGRNLWLLYSAQNTS